MSEALIEQLKESIITTLGLEDVAPNEIDADAPLFGEGLGLDSIDALELVVMIEKQHGIRLEDMETSRKAFATVRTLAEFITTHGA